jgi:hypothetical protein
MAYVLDDAIAELYSLSQGPIDQLTIYSVQDAASKCGMDLPNFLRAVRSARPRLTDMRLLKPGADKVLKVWKGIVNLSKSSASTAEFTEAVSAATEAGSSLLSSLAGLPGLILLALILTGLAAGYYWANHMGDKPVKAGGAMSGLHPGRGPNAWTPAPIGQHDKYYIYAVNTSGWSLYVGRPSDVEGRPAGTLTDGGTGDTPVEYKKLVNTAFDNSDAALAYLKAHISPGHESRWTGTWVKFEGAEYRTVHLGL